MVFHARKKRLASTNPTDEALAEAGPDHEVTLADSVGMAPTAGAAFVFLEPESLSGELRVSDADLQFTTTYAGATLEVASVGGADGDGLGDFGFDLTITFEEKPGGLLVTGGLSSGTHDVLDASFAQLYAAGDAVA